MFESQLVKKINDCSRPFHYQNLQKEGSSKNRVAEGFEKKCRFQKIKHGRVKKPKSFLDWKHFLNESVAAGEVCTAGRPCPFSFLGHSFPWRTWMTLGPKQIYGTQGENLKHDGRTGCQRCTLSPSLAGIAARMSAVYFVSWSGGENGQNVSGVLCLLVWRGKRTKCQWCTLSFSLAGKTDRMSVVYFVS